MRMLDLALQFLLMADAGVAVTEANSPADAIWPEHVRTAVARLKDLNFSIREEAGNELLGMGFGAVAPLTEAAEKGSIEVSVRAFQLLLNLYRKDDEPTFEAVEKAIRRLEHSSEISASARAERFFKTVAESREVRAREKFKRLGGVIHLDDPDPDRRYFLIEHDWEGGDEGLKLLDAFKQVHERATLIVVQGTKVSDAALLELSTELQMLAIHRRGLARLGVRGLERGAGCWINFVEPDSAADRAGLKANDLIVEIDGVPIETFSDLVEVVKKKKCGDQLPVSFFREGELKQVVAELLPWK